MRQTADPLHVLHGDRPVEPKLLFQLFLFRDVDHAGCVEHDIRDVAGHHPQHREDQHGNPEQRQEHQEEAPDQISPHHDLPSCAGKGAPGRPSRPGAPELDDYLSSQTSS